MYHATSEKAKVSILKCRPICRSYQSVSQLVSQAINQSINYDAHEYKIQLNDKKLTVRTERHFWKRGE